MSDNLVGAKPDSAQSLWELRKKAVNSLGGTIGHMDFPTGDLSGLRNLKLDATYPPAYWRLLTNPERVPPELSQGEKNEMRWAVLMQAMAIMAPGGHRPGASLGRVLARMDRGTMESRLMKLLTSRGQGTWDQIRHLARMLASQGQAVDFNDLAGLLFSPEGPLREQARNHIARHYFSQMYSKESKADSNEQ